MRRGVDFLLKMRILLRIGEDAGLESFSSEGEGTGTLQVSLHIQQHGCLEGRQVALVWGHRFHSPDSGIKIVR